MGAVKRLTRTGPRTLPCGTPTVILRGEETTILTKREKVLPWRYDSNHFKAVPKKP
jgi:hypothetical protein